MNLHQHWGQVKDEMLNKLCEEQGMWRRKHLELAELKEKVLMGKVICIPGWKAEEEEECPSRKSGARQKSREKNLVIAPFVRIMRESPLMKRSTEAMWNEMILNLISIIIKL